MVMRTLLAVLSVCVLAVAGFALVPVAAPPAPTQDTSPSQLVVHEWGTFTSFSGSNGVPVGFEPNNNDLPSFVYHTVGYYQEKGGRLRYGGLVSMETPVIYFYADRAMRVGVKVDFPRGWITEWYPFAAGSPGR